MKLRNKKTGETIDVCKGKVILHYDNGRKTICFKSLEELDDWEDYEEPKEDYIRVIDSFIDYVEKADESFDCDESVQKFVDKLKAWKRLKDKGIRFFNNKIIGEYGNVSYRLTYPATTIEEKQLDTLFGGEE